METERLYINNIMDSQTKACYRFISDIKEASSHSHCHDFFEIMLVISGKAIHFINGQECSISDGALIFIRPDDTHYFGKLGSFDCQFINIAFPLETLYELSNFLGEEFPIVSLLTASEVPSVILSTVEKKIIRQKFERLFLFPVTQKQYMKMELRALLTHILTNYFVSAPHLISNNIPLWLDELCMAMNNKANFLIGIEMMKSLSGKSHEHICRVFKKYYGITPIHFINELKLNYSANLLTNTDLSILDISEESGFESLSHFYYLFKSRFGFPPADYRRQKQNSGFLI